MIVYGRQPVAELLRSRRRRALQIWATKDPGVPFQQTTPDQLTARAGTDAHQGIVAEAEPYPYAGAAADAASNAFAIDWPECVALVLGAEGKGLRPRVAKACDQLVSVPMRGRLGSLNVSATAAVLTYLAMQREFLP